MRIAICGLALFAASPTAAEILNGAPSTGTLPSLTVDTAVTLSLPDDGKLIYENITISSGGVLRFTRNSLNTPVYLIARSSITINGQVRVDGGNGDATRGGIGGPGGFDGGTPGVGSVAPGVGRGPGGGRSGGARPGHGTYATAATTPDGQPYGSPLLVPLVGGSGSAGRTGIGGGGGGGAILIAAGNEIVLNGTVSATGGINGQFCVADQEAHGSGGGVRLVAPRIAGAGQIDARGAGYCFFSGHGRVRIDAIDRGDLVVSIPAGPAVSHGKYLVAFPTVVPRLDIVAFDGSPVAAGTAATITLPFGSGTAHTVQVRAQGFGSGGARAFLRLEPQSGDATLIPLSPIANGTTADVDVTLEVNNPTKILVWGDPQ